MHTFTEPLSTTPPFNTPVQIPALLPTPHVPYSPAGPTQCSLASRHTLTGTPHLQESLQTPEQTLCPPDATAKTQDALLTS